MRHAMQESSSKDLTEEKEQEYVDKIEIKRFVVSYHKEHVSSQFTRHVHSALMKYKLP